MKYWPLIVKEHHGPLIDKKHVSICVYDYPVLRKVLLIIQNDVTVRTQLEQTLINMSEGQVWASIPITTVCLPYLYAQISIINE